MVPSLSIACKLISATLVVAFRYGSNPANILIPHRAANWN